MLYDTFSALLIAYCAKFIVKGVKMPYPHRMAWIIEETYQSTPEHVIPELMKKHGSPHLVAKEMALRSGETLSTNSVRAWLLKHHWTVRYGRWSSPNTERNTKP